MHETHEILADLTILLAAAVTVVVVLSRLRLPTIAGFVVAGALLGPSGLGIVQSSGGVEVLAEVGVILLLFTIGLEFSLGRLRRIWRVVAFGGGLQVGLTTLAVTAAAVGAGFGVSQGVFFGFLLALSSTAIVLRGLAERGETDAPHGQLIVGALLFQDLCIVPMILLVPLLAGGGGGASAVVLALGKAAAVVVATVALARGAVPRVLYVVARSRRRDLFVLVVLTLCLGIAGLTAWAGLSLALGAFLAGMVLAESQYGDQALSDVLPLSDSLSSLFFLSMGLLLDVGVLASEPVGVAGLVLLILAGKGALATLAGVAMRFPIRVALLSGISLAQVGEFSFVLARLGHAEGLIGDEPLKIFLAASVITMLVTPLAMRAGPHLAAGAVRLGGLERLLGVGNDAEHTPAPPREGHVLVLGFGLGGQLVAEALRATGVPHAVVDVAADRIRDAQARGEPAYYGDVTSSEILERLHVSRARQVVILINDPAAIRRCVAAVRALAPEVPILVRTQYLGETPALLAAGATQVVAQELEASLEVLAATLAAAEVPGAVIGQHMRRARHRGIGGSAPAEPALSELERGGRASVASFLVRPGSWIVGRHLGESGLRRATGATVMAFSRDDDVMTHPQLEERFAVGDVLYLIGSESALRAARSLLESGPAVPGEAEG